MQSGNLKHTYIYSYIFFGLLNQKRHKISDKFDFGPDRDYSLWSYLPLSAKICPHRLIMKKMFVDTIAPSFLIGSSSNLQVPRTAIKSGTSSNSSHICPSTLELPALENQKKCCGHDSACSFDRLFFKLVYN